LARISASLLLPTRTLLDALLERSDDSGEQEDEGSEQEEADVIKRKARPDRVSWHDLKTNPGAIGLESVLFEKENFLIA
jgi:hypothetical protein